MDPTRHGRFELFGGQKTIMEDSASSLEETLGLGYFGVTKIIEQNCGPRKTASKICPPGDSSRALFGMVKWPFGKVKLPSTGGWKGHIESPGK